MEIMPSACESEMHVCFQQKEIFDYLTEHKIQPDRIHAAWFPTETGER